MNWQKRWDALVEMYWSDSMWGFLIEKRYAELEKYVGMVEEIISTRKTALGRDCPLPLDTSSYPWMHTEVEKSLLEFEDVFPQELYRSAIMSAYSYLDTVYDVICRDTARRRGQPPPQEAMKKSDAKGIERSKKFARDILGVQFSHQALWTEMVALRAVRNACTHSAGILVKKKDVRRVEAFCNKYPDRLTLVRMTSRDQAVVLLSPTYCRYVLDLCIRFLKVVLGDVWLSEPRPDVDSARIGFVRSAPAISKGKKST